MLCAVEVMLPLNSMNINILNVVGRSDLYLKLQMIVQALAIPNIFIGVFFGIKALILGMIVIVLFGYVIFNHESNKILNYTITEQLNDIFPGLLLATVMGLLVFIIQLISNFRPAITLITQLITGIIIVIFTGKLLKMKEYNFIKNIIIEKLKPF